MCPEIAPLLRWYLGGCLAERSCSTPTRVLPFQWSHKVTVSQRWRKNHHAFVCVCRVTSHATCVATCHRIARDSGVYRSARVALSPPGRRGAPVTLSPTSWCILLSVTSASLFPSNLNQAQAGLWVAGRVAACGPNKTPLGSLLKLKPETAELLQPSEYNQV